MQPFEPARQGNFEQSRGGWMLLGRLLRWSMRNCGEADQGGASHSDPNGDVRGPKMESLDATA